MDSVEKTFRIMLIGAWIKGWQAATSNPYPQVALNKATDLITEVLPGLDTAPQTVDYIKSTFYDYGIKHARQWEDGGLWV